MSLSNKTTENVDINSVITRINTTINIYLYILFLIDRNLCLEKYTIKSRIVKNKLPKVNIKPVNINTTFYILK